MEVPGKVFLSKCRLTGLILRYGIKYDHKNIFSTQGQYYKTFYDRNLRIFVIGLSVCPLQAFQVLNSRVGFWPYPQTLGLAGKALSCPESLVRSIFTTVNLIIL
jgi:hypothetical protein